MMNKKETAAMDDLRKQLAIAKAMRFTEPVLPDVPIPSGHDTLTKGFLFAGGFNSYARVEPSCSSSAHHNFGRTEKTTTQNPRTLYSTKLLALRAMRYAVEKECAQTLAGIDQQIENEQRPDNPPKAE